MAGVVAYDLPRYLKHLYGEPRDYLAICNRQERLVCSPDSPGYLCDWQWTSELHGAKVLPVLGRKMFQKAFHDHPIRFSEAPESATSNPEISFVIGHRGLVRLPHLKATLASIAAQRGVSFECIVVEQDTKPKIQDKLPAWVRYVHQSCTSNDMPYNRSMAFNQGVQLASGDLVILHDNDMPVPQDYAAANFAVVAKGYDVINLKRFIFYLDRKTSELLSTNTALPRRPRIEAILQNAQGGGSISISRNAYWSIGGMDESFVGWGGEDNEFWERAETLRVYSFGTLSLLHLWHAPQPDKLQAQVNGVSRYQIQSQVDPLVRIQRLKEKVRRRSLVKHLEDCVRH